MEPLHIILPIAVGALIGYCTNYIAIKMLFRPRRELRVGGHRVPFTPGVIPKNQGRIAAAVGHAVSDTLLTQEDLAARLTGGAAKEKLVASLRQTLTEDPTPLADRLPQAGRADLTEAVSQAVSGKILRGLKQVDMTRVVGEIAQTSFGDLMGNPMVAMFLGGGMIDSICQKLSQALGDFVDQRGPDLVVPLVQEELAGLGAKPLGAGLMDLGLSPAAFDAILEGVVDQALSAGLQPVLASLDVQAVVEEKIKAMDARDLEDLVLSVMKNELQAVVNLGAVIGGLIGIVNIFL